jgi:virulence-associated protein VapD
MALKYLQLPEPTYIPKYASVDPQVLGQVTSQIENQIQQGRQSLSALDQLEDNTSQALSILPDSYKQQYKEVLNRTRAQLDEDVEKYGYRNIQGKVRNLARDFQNEVAPLMQTAGQVSAAYKRIDESSADGMSKQVGRQAIQQALEGNADFSPPQYLAAFENWRDLRKEINDFASKWKEGTVSQREQVIDSPGGQYIYRSLIQSGRPDEFARAAALMLQDQQSLTQLEIMTRARRPDYDNLDNESKQKEVL